MSYSRADDDDAGVVIDLVSVNGLRNVEHLSVCFQRNELTG